MRRHVFLPIIHDNPYFCFPESVGWYKEDPSHYVKREKDELSCYNLHIILNGKGYLKTRNEIHSLLQGDAFLYFPNEEQEYFSDKEQPWEVMWVHFRSDFAREFFIERGFLKSTVWALKMWNPMENLIIDLLEEAEQFGILHPSVLSTLTYSIITELITQIEKMNGTKGDIYSRITSVLPFMREASSKPFVLEYWADNLSISTFYFCKMFKKTTGMSPSQFIMLCRIQKSKQLLMEENNWSIKQIAIECGYPSTSYFGKVFLQNEGVTPAEYRKQRM